MNIYSPLNPSAFFLIQRRQREFRRIFADAFPDGVENVKLLEIGCGGGQWLAEFQTYGFRIENFSGIELDPERTEDATKRIPGADIRQGNAAELPWDGNSFDIVFQSTVFTSVLDDELRKKIASEMKRVCKDSGFILWYDFMYNNPKNPNVKGVSPSLVRELFAPWKCESRKVSLAPPVSRRMVPVSWTLAELTETFCPFLRSHLISKIHS